MVRFITNKLVDAAIVVIVVSFAASALVDLIPGDVASQILGPTAPASAVRTLTNQLGLNRPLWDRYYIWVLHALHGNLGTSVESNQSVVSMLVSHFPVTLEIALITLIASLAVAIPLALLCAARPDGVADKLVRGLCSGLISVPSFVACVVLTIALSVETGLLPSFGWVPLTQDFGQNLLHVALTVITLFFGVMPLFLRVLRADLIAVLREDYVLAARARGLPGRYVMLRHALRPASLSLFTLSGLILGYLVGGSIILETFFSLPGVGLIVGQAVGNKDVAVVQGVVVVMAVLYVVINGLVDLGYRYIDPRAGKGGGR
jgi:peptide/nickel transport system permease protein